MFNNEGRPATLVIFCKVIDNFGDIGICWRLSRQFLHEHGIAVTLWVDDLASFARICPGIDVDAVEQAVDGVTVRHWRGQDGEFAPAEVADVVIEFFGCELPPGYVEAMAQREPKPVWINYEGLSAEDWVEGCHLLPSPHPRLPIRKYFFFPGFTSKTGGLLHEAGLDGQRMAFQSDPTAVAAFLGRFGVTSDEMRSLKVSLFCYPHAPVASLFEVWESGGSALTCLVPEGVAPDAVRAFLGAEPAAGAWRRRGALTVRVIPFVPQPDYDRLLWACDLNFVRGEDSWVRAQWAGRPFVWHIYPQDENLHHKKLRAFLQRYINGIDSIGNFSLCWNGAVDASAHGGWHRMWSFLQSDMSAIARRADDWYGQMLANGDAASSLLKFAASLQS